MKTWLALRMTAFYTKAVPGNIAVRFQDPLAYEAYDPQDVETPAFLRKAFGLKVRA